MMMIPKRNTHAKSISNQGKSIHPFMY
jgi:hypothetical protein